MRPLRKIRHFIALPFSKKYRQKNAVKKEDVRLQNLPRFQHTSTTLKGRNVKIPDSASYLFMRHEIFEQQIYRFNSDDITPCIIDCGANIGLSVIYFKELYPQAKIVAFEPDKKVFEALKYNVESFEFTNVELINKACWNEETILQFHSEGADGGRAAKDSDRENIIEVKAVRLKEYLDCKVDFLKIDIEGAENEVLPDIKDMLGNVERIFVEFHSFIGREQMLPEILEVLKQAGFRLHISAPGLVSASPFFALTTLSNMDNQVNIYGFREVSNNSFS